MSAAHEALRTRVQNERQDVDVSNDPYDVGYWARCADFPNPEDGQHGLAPQEQNQFEEGWNDADRELVLEKSKRVPK